MPLWMTSPKKQAKIRTLRRSVRAEAGQVCLDIGHASGAVYCQLAALGGTWFCAMVVPCTEDNRSRSVEWVSLVVGPGDLPFASHCFDAVCAVDILEHLQADQAFVQELHRILQDRGSLYLSVPRVDGNLLLRNWGLRSALGRSYHGHVRDGYTQAQLQALLERSGFEVLATETFSGLFTEIFDVVCRVVYRWLAARRARASQSRSAPDSRAHPAASVLFCLIQPFVWLLRVLDAISPAESYGVFVAAQKIETCASQRIEVVRKSSRDKTAVPE